MKKKICIVTAARAEYGLLRPVINKIMRDGQLEAMVAVTGAHLSPEFGLTAREIEKDGIAIDKKIEILLSADTAPAISKSMGLALIGFSDYFEDKNKTREVLTAQQQIEEKIMLGLRCQEGVSIIDLQKLGYDITKNHNLSNFVKNGILKINGDKITLNPDFYGVSNSVIVKLLP